MKCPICGTDNKSSNKACYRCGGVLADDGPQHKSQPNLQRYTKSEHKKAQQPPPFWGDAKGKPIYEDKGNFVVLNDESTPLDASEEQLPHDVKIPDNRSKLKNIANGGEITVVLPAERRNRRPSQSRRYNVNWRRFTLTTVLILLLTASVTYGGVLAYRYGVAAVSHWFEQRQGTEPAQDPLVEKILINGESWHRITFYGVDGEQVLVTDPRWTEPIQNGKAELLLDDQSYIPDKLTAEKGKVTVQLAATIFSPDDEEKKITIPPYTIDVPLSPLKVVQPELQAIETTENRVFIKVKVTPGSRVNIGSDNATDRVSKDGYVTSSAKIEPKGLNQVKITVETKKHRENVYILQVTRQIMTVPIELDKNVKDNTTEGIIEISGTTKPGATLTTDAKLKGNLILDKATGKFHFNATLNRWGWNDITLTATNPDGTSSSMTHKVEHKPTLEGYTKKAWPIDDYSYLSTAAESLIGTVYVCEGQVIKKMDGESDNYMFNIGTASAMKLVAMECSRDTGLTPGKFYKIFADVSGVYESYPALTARFIYDMDIPAGYGTANPDVSQSPGASPTAGAAQ